MNRDPCICACFLYTDSIILGLETPAHVTEWSVLSSQRSGRKMDFISIFSKRSLVFWLKPMWCLEWLNRKLISSATSSWIGGASSRSFP